MIPPSVHAEQEHALERAGDHRRGDQREPRAEPGEDAAGEHSAEPGAHRRDDAAEPHQERRQPRAPGNAEPLLYECADECKDGDRDEVDRGEETRRRQRDVEVPAERRGRRPDGAGRIAEAGAEQDDADPDPADSWLSRSLGHGATITGALGDRRNRPQGPGGGDSDGVLTVVRIRAASTMHTSRADPHEDFALTDQ